MDKNLNWDLECLLDNKSLDQLFLEYQDSNKILYEKYTKRLDSIEDFVSYHQIALSNEILENKLKHYLSNKNNEDLADAYIIGWLQKFDKEHYEISLKLANQHNEIYKNEAKIKKFLEDERVCKFKLTYDHLLRYKKYTLDEEQEKLLVKVSRQNAGFDDIFSTLVDSDMQFDDALDKDNKPHKIKNLTDVSVLLKSKDQTLRKNAYYSKAKAFYNMKNTLTKTLYYEYLMLNQNSKVRGFDDYISNAAFSDEVSVDFINLIYEEVKKFKPLIVKYHKLRDKYLKYKFNLKTIKPWDNYLDLTTKKFEFSIQDAKKIALESLAIMGDDYIKIVREAFDNNWISWLPRPNKISGAYSIDDTKGIDKIYILMNYDKTYSSVLTLVHELGHSVHTKVANQHQEIYNDYEIFYAEISSVTNEVLTNYYLLDKYKNDLQKQLLIYDEMISSFFATTTRQITFSKFESIANQWVNEGSEFSWDKIAKTFIEINNEFCGSKIDVSKKISKENQYKALIAISVPHFYSGNFYVYKYAIGQFGATIMGERIASNDEAAKQKMFEFFKSGGTLSPLDTIKLLDIDLTNKDVYQQIYKVVEKWIKNYELIIKKLIKTNN